jgi:hypothetical protein
MRKCRILPAEDTTHVVDFGDQRLLELAQRRDEPCLYGIVEAVPTDGFWIAHDDPTRRFTCSESLTLTDLIVNFSLRKKLNHRFAPSRRHQMRYETLASTGAAGEFHYPDRRS